MPDRRQCDCDALGPVTGRLYIHGLRLWPEHRENVNGFHPRPPPPRRAVSSARYPCVRSGAGENDAAWAYSTQSTLNRICIYIFIVHAT